MTQRTWTLPTPRGDSRKDKVTCFMRQNGICACGCGQKLHVKGYILEHIVPLEEGGADDLSNKAAYAIPCAKAKTKREAAARAEYRRKRDKHIGAIESKNPMPGSRRSPWKKTFNRGWVRR
jgi:5-methylcytosine-specific restriction protein A